MSTRARVVRAASILLCWLGIVLFRVGDAFAQLDPSWTVSVNGQTVSVDLDGTFSIPNVSAADQFGPGGIGTAPDFVSDDYVRVTGVSPGNGGGPMYLYAPPFRFSNNETVFLSSSDLIFSTSPPPFPERIRIGAPTTVLEVDQEVQLSVVGILIDGSEIDLTPSSSATTYRTSNPTIVTVDSEGRVVARGVGSAVVTATNEGAAAVKGITVATTVVTTAVIGFVRDAAGQGVAGADVSILGFEESAVSQAPDGRFEMPEVHLPPEVSEIVVRASADLGGTELTGSTTADVVADGLTDAGIIFVIQNVITNGGFETGDFTGYIPTGNASVVTNVGFVLPPEGTYMGLVNTGPSGTIGQIRTNEFQVPSGGTDLVFSLNFMTDEFDQGPAFNDFVRVLLVPSVGDPVEIIRITRDQLLAGVYEVVPAPTGFDVMTDFLSVSADVSGYAGQLICLDLDIQVQDVGDQSVDSAALIDDIRLEFASGARMGARYPSRQWVTVDGPRLSSELRALLAQTRETRTR